MTNNSSEFEEFLKWKKSKESASSETKDAPISLKSKFEVNSVDKLAQSIVTPKTRKPRKKLSAEEKAARKKTRTKEQQDAIDARVKKMLEAKKKKAEERKKNKK